MMSRNLVALSLLAALGGCSGTVGTPGGESTADLKKVPAGGAFSVFETLQVRPLALSPSGKMLFAANTPDNRLEIFARQRAPSSRRSARSSSASSRWPSRRAATTRSGSSITSRTR